MQMNRRTFLGSMCAAGAAATMPGFGDCGNCGTTRVAVQLYSIRKYIDKVGLAQALKDVAKIGYKGVEFAGYYKNDAKTLKKMLDDAGFPDCGIVASNSLDEYLISDMLEQGAEITSFGVGERMITAKSSPVLDGVYKLCAIEEDGKIIPKIKISENVTKITTPGVKEVWRLYDKETGKAEADVLTLTDEVIDESKPYLLFDPDYTWKQKTLENFTARKLLEPVFVGGKCVFQRKPIDEIQKYCKEQVDTLWEEVTRFEHPHNYYVDLSQELWDEKYRLLKEHSSKV